VSHYTANGAYLDSAAEPPFDRNPRISFDPRGIPKVLEPSGYEYNPVTIAQWGLRGETLWDLRRERHGRADATAAALWLTRHQRFDGAWPYEFSFAPAGMDAPLPAGWASAMAQGQAMSLLTRVARRTSSRAMARAARRGLLPLEYSVRRGGLVVTFGGHKFYEEFPTQPPSLALNGFMFTLVGLYDVGRIAPASAAQRLFRQGMATLRWALPLYDTEEGLSIYHLGYLTQPGQPLHQSLYYHGVHILLLRALDHVAPASVLRRYADRWNRYVARKGDPA